jgi:hypothetical protein
VTGEVLGDLAGGIIGAIACAMIGAIIARRISRGDHPAHRVPYFNLTLEQILAARRGNFHIQYSGVQSATLWSRATDEPSLLITTQGKGRRRYKFSWDAPAGSPGLEAMGRAKEVLRGHFGSRLDLQ